MILWKFVIILVLLNASTSQFYEDQPKILVNEGNLVFESADSKDVTVRLKGRSRFFVNNIDILSSLNPSNGTNSPNAISLQALGKITAEFNKLKLIVRNQNTRIENLEMGGNYSTVNATLPSDRQSINRLRRRISTLEQRVANLTERMSRDYCRSYPCQNHGTCHTLLDGYRCECPENFEGPQCTVDVNECSKYAGTELGCQNGATCINTIGSYECSCMDSWKGKSCNRRKVDCLSVPQMEICGHGSCIPDNNKDGYSCICMQGWRKDNNSQACTQDVDECMEMRPHCSFDPPVACINTPGSFVCGPCPQGYTGNGFYCTDINECDSNNGGCSTSPRVECINARGSFRCGSCPFGFDGDGKTCLPSTRPSNVCADSSMCNPNAVCYQYSNSAPTCYCKPGFTGNGYGEHGCVQNALDPCNNLMCRNGGMCVRNGSTAYCSCPPGTSPPLCDRTLNLCEPNPCLNGGNCTAMRFSNNVRCSCPRGFSGNRCQNQAATCGGVLNSLNGTLRYPTDSRMSTYSHNSRCAWLIKTNHTKVLNITFQTFNIEISPECRYDWLQIHDGRSAASQIIGRFCGDRLPRGGNFISTHNQLYLWFRSDNSTAQEGFELTWDSIDPECGEEKNITGHGIIASPGSPGNYPINRDCEWILFAPPGKRIQFLFYTLMIESHATCEYDYLEMHSGVGIDSTSIGKYCNSTIPAPVLTPGNIATIHFHSDGDSSDAGFQIAYSIIEGIPGCGGTFTSSRGDISSPIDVATGGYKNNLICDYVIQMPSGSRIKIEFKKFKLEEGSSCQFDKIEIFEGPENDENGLLGRYCGTNIPPPIISLTNTITIRFVSDWSQAEDGFQMTYQLICGGTFTSDSGVVSSPNYPNNYDGDNNCEYDIIAPQGKVIVLNVVDFDIEQHSSCDFDYLQIFDGNSADNATSLGRYCGDKKPGLFTSSFNYLHVEFASDSSIFGRGFQANYTFVDVECGGLIKDSKEVVQPPMDTDGNGVYKSNAFCQWLVVAPPGFVIQMNIMNFDLESDSTCKYDYIKIFNNGSGNGDQIGPYCGSNAPRVLTTVDNIATIVFASDSSTSKDGFTITFNFIDATRLCGGNFYTSHGVIRSPGQPAYLPNKDCEWLVTAPNGQQIQMSFNYFELEKHDSCKFDGLEIINGGSKLAPMLGKFCGEDVPHPFKSMSNQVFLRFYSDSSRNGKGFEIVWDATTSGCGGILTSAKSAIQSPNYPISYPHNSQCEWRISVNEGSNIQIVFSDLDMEQHEDCKYDYLEIFDGTDASAKSYGKFCSSEQHPIHIETSGNHAMIRMNTDESQSGRGFHIKYSASCNRTIEANTGIIESLNFPQDYPNNLDCAWIIRVSKGNRINMQFSHFDIENDNLYHNDTNHVCKYDYVALYDFDSETNERKTETLKYCNKAPAIRNSTADSVVVIFHTDQSKASSGFRLEWYNEGCGGKLTHPSGSLTSPNYPNRYNHEIVCIWEIAIEYGYNINLTVQDMEMEKSTTCEFDSLIIANDKSFNNTIAKICESIRQPVVITVDGHRAFVKFESDETHNAKGFNITYETIVADCGGIFTSMNGVIKTPSYPKMNYDFNKTCEWIIKTDNAHRLTFQLIDFDLEESVNCSKDSLEIHDPIFNEMIWKGCGSQMPNITKFLSKRNELVVRLISDGTVNAKGFIGNFTISCGGRFVTNDTGEIMYRSTGESQDCVWTIIADDPSKHVTLTFTYSRIFFDMEMECFTRIHVFEGDIDELGAERTRFCGSKVPPAIVSNGNSLTVYLNTTSMSSLSEFDIHYSVLDNACGGIYERSIHGDFASPNYPGSSALNTYCEWTLLATAGNSLALEIKTIDIATSENCYENYLEIRKTNANGELVGLYCGNEAPMNLVNSQGYWIKYRTGETASNNGFLAKFKYLSENEIEGTSGVIESPNYPYVQRGSLLYSYRISVRQNYVIRIEFKDFYVNEDDPEDCLSYLKFYNGYDNSAPPLTPELCYDSVDPFVSEANMVFIELHHSAFGKSRFKLEWNEIEKKENPENVTIDGCGKLIISLTELNDFINITSPGYPLGYNSSIDCEWIIMSGLTSYHPVLQFVDVDLEDLTDCVGDYALISTSNTETSWSEVAKLCQMDIRERKYYHGTPNIKLNFHSDYSQNMTGFSAVTYLYCGNILTDSNGIIEFDTMKNPGLRTHNCMWNITVSRGRKIKFEFIELNIRNVSSGCDSYVLIKNGHDDLSPYLGTGQYCSDPNVEIPLTSGNRGFVKFKTNSPFRNIFRLRYSEVQHECGGEIKLSDIYRSSIITSPNYPNIPHPHIECTWIVIAPVGEEIRIDFLDRFDLTYAQPCEKEYVELREGSTTAASVIGTFCGSSKPPTKYTKSNVLRINFFTDISEPKNGFKLNISIGVCGGTLRTTDIGYLSSPKYPGQGAYPTNMTCDYRIIGPVNNIFTIKILDIDLPSISDEYDSDEVLNVTCSLERDHFKLYSVVPDGNSTDRESWSQMGIFCGDTVPTGLIVSESNEIVVRFKTSQKELRLYKGFRLFYNTTKLSCGGIIEADSGFITSVGYPSRTLSKSFCEWRITVPKGKRIRLDFVDVDLINTASRFAQRVGIYNDFSYSNRVLFVSNSTHPDVVYSSDNKMMISSWIRVSSKNRGFKLRFSSDDDTICTGDLNQLEGAIFPPMEMNMTAFTCSYYRNNVPILQSSPSTGTIAYYFTNLQIGRRITNCRYAATAINVLVESMLKEKDRYLGRICGNLTASLTVLSPFPDVKIEIKQSPYFGKINFDLRYKTHRCGGIFRSGTQMITNPPANTADYQILDCAWFIGFEAGFSVAMTVQKLNLKLPCEQEYLTIYNGPTATSTLLMKLCGNEFNSDQLLSLKESIYIEYHTDNFNGASKDSVFEIKAESSSFGCGGILNHFTNKFTSPLYDKPYPANTECTWEIRASKGFHVGLKFTDRFFIQESPNCTKDYIEVYDLIDNDWKFVNKFCGRDTPKQINSTYDRLKVVFQSDDSISGDGFKAEWDEICGGIIRVDQQTRTLVSPKYPLYTPSLNCNYTFVSSVPDAFINLNFLDFDIESANGKCIYDNVTLYRLTENGMYVHTDYGKLGFFCGTTNPGSFRYKDPLSVILRTDKWIERKGFQIEYSLDSCGGIVKNSTEIASPTNLRTNIKNVWDYLGALHCVWNITAPVDKNIVVKFERIDLDYSPVCSYDYVEVYSGKVDDEMMRLVKLCGNITVNPIIIENPDAVIKLRTDQTRNTAGFKAVVWFQQRCSQTINLTKSISAYVIDKSNQQNPDNVECIYKIRGEPLSVLKFTFSEIHLSICDPDKPHANMTKWECNCDYVEVLNGNGPFSESIGKFCGHDIPAEFVTTGSAAYVRFVTDSIRSSTGFKLTVQMIESPCGSTYYNFSSSFNETFVIESPKALNLEKYPPNIACQWIIEAPIRESFEISFDHFELEESANCSADSLKIEDSQVKEYILEGLGQEVIYTGKDTISLNPSFYMGTTGPTAPHIYCGSVIPHVYHSATEKIKIMFTSDSRNEYKGFKMTIKSKTICSRTYTALQGRLVSSNQRDTCRATIKVPHEYTISLYFMRFMFYQNDCEKEFMKVYDGDFDNGALLKTLCGYTTPEPIFSNGNEISISVMYEKDGSSNFHKGSYDILYLASERSKGPGCGGEIFNYGGVFSSPFYPNNNRSNFDCLWTVSVPQNLKMAMKFAVFDMGTKLTCENDYVEILEENVAKEFIVIKTYCGDDQPAIYVSANSKLRVHHKQTVHFSGTGWMINFMGIHEGATPSEW